MSSSSQGDAAAATTTELSPEVQCALCLSLMHEPVTTPCDHFFCYSCLEKALLYNPCCPMCRADLAHWKLDKKKCLPAAQWESKLLEDFKISPTTIFSRKKEAEKESKIHKITIEYGNTSELVGAPASNVPFANKQKYKWVLYVDYAKAQQQNTKRAMPPLSRYIKAVKFNINPGFDSFITVQAPPFALERVGALEPFTATIQIVWKEQMKTLQPMDELHHKVIVCEEGRYCRNIVKEIPASLAPAPKQSTASKPVGAVDKSKPTVPPPENHSNSASSAARAPPAPTKKQVTKSVAPVEPTATVATTAPVSAPVQSSSTAARTATTTTTVKSKGKEPAVKQLPSTVKLSAVKGIQNIKTTGMLSTGYVETSYGHVFLRFIFPSNKKLILFVHGSGSRSSSADYESTIHELALYMDTVPNHDYFLVAMDCPGYGASTGSKQSIRSYPTQVIREVVTQLGFAGAFALYGHSQGGAAIFNAMIEDQSLAAKLVQDRPVFATGKVTLLNSVKAPTLLVFDVDDQGHPVKTGRLLHKELPVSSWVEYSSSKNEFWWSDNFPRVMLDFLNK